MNNRKAKILQRFATIFAVNDEIIMAHKENREINKKIIAESEKKMYNIWKRIYSSAKNSKEFFDACAYLAHITQEGAIELTGERNGKSE